MYPEDPRAFKRPPYSPSKGGAANDDGLGLERFTLTAQPSPYLRCPILRQVSSSGPQIHPVSGKSSEVPPWALATRAHTGTQGSIPVLSGPSSHPAGGAGRDGPGRSLD